MTFIGPPPTSGAWRELFLSAKGSWTALNSAAALRSAAERTGLPLAFALYPPRPNPSRSATSIRFDLPRVSEVSIDIFDVQGRKVETLLHGARLADRVKPARSTS